VTCIQYFLYLFHKKNESTLQKKKNRIFNSRKKTCEGLKFPV
jgi:hypothetical protein